MVSIVRTSQRFTTHLIPPPEIWAHPNASAALAAQTHEEIAQRLPTSLAGILAYRQDVWAKGYRPVPVKTAGKAPKGLKWPEAARRDPPLCAMPDALVFPEAVNTGNLCDGLRALDLDIDDAAVVAEIEALAIDLLGRAPTRFRSDSPRILMVYRAAEGEPAKRAIKGEKGKIEVLGKGQQFVADGLHTDGATLEWRDGSLDTTSTRDLSCVSEAMVEDFLEVCKPIIGWTAPKAETELPVPARALTPAQRATATTFDHARDPGAFFRAVNDAALANLGQWVPSIFAGARRQAGGGFRVSSRQLGRKLQEDLSLAPNGIVDFGVADMGDSREGRRTPIDVIMEHGGISELVPAAHWLCDQLGRAPEDFGWADDASDFVINLDDDEVVDPETGEITTRPVVDYDDLPALAADPFGHLGDPLAPLPDELTRGLPGLVGALVEHILSSARGPVPSFALFAALTMVGTLGGRRWLTPTESSLVLYAVCLAPTGVGKDHALREIWRIFDFAGLDKMVASGKFTAPGAVINHVKTKPCSIMIADEMHEEFRKWGDRRGPEAIKQVPAKLRELWGANGGVVMGDNYSVASGENFIRNPAVSLYGIAPTEAFFEALQSRQLMDGTLNRFLFAHQPAEVDDRDPPRSKQDESPELSQWIGETIGPSGEKTGTVPIGLLEANNVIKPSIMTWADQEARDKWSELRARQKALSKIGKSFAEVTSRMAEMSQRCAAIMALGCDAISPAITAEMLEWGWAIVERSTALLVRGGRDYSAETDNQVWAKAIMRALRELGGETSKRAVFRKLDHSIDHRRFEAVAAGLIEAGQIVRSRSPSSPKGGRPSEVWTAASAPG